MTSVDLGSIDKCADYSVTTPDRMSYHQLIKTSLQIVETEVGCKTMEHSPDSVSFHIHIFPCQVRGPKGWASKS